VATGKEQKITIAGTSGLNKDEVARMVKDAEAHAAEDKNRRELIDARNQADSLAYSVEKTVSENRDRLPAADVSRIESAVTALRDAVAGESIDAIKRASDDLQKASHAMAEQLYKHSEANAANAGSANKKDDDVKEGEVVDA
jgi:molecular chaperone DnaK